MICIAGTGSIAYGRNANRKFARVGGWGYIFGDEGGGFDLTRQALRAILRHEEGWGPDTVLRSMLLRRNWRERCKRSYASLLHDAVSASADRILFQARRCGCERG